MCAPQLQIGISNPGIRNILAVEIGTLGGIAAHCFAKSAKGWGSIVSGAARVGQPAWRNEDFETTVGVKCSQLTSLLLSIVASWRSLLSNRYWLPMPSVWRWTRREVRTRHWTASLKRRSPDCEKCNPGERCPGEDMRERLQGLQVRTDTRTGQGVQSMIWELREPIFDKCLSIRTSCVR